MYLLCSASRHRFHTNRDGLPEDELYGFQRLLSVLQGSEQAAELDPAFAGKTKGRLIPSDTEACPNTRQAAWRSCKRAFITKRPTRRADHIVDATGLSSIVLIENSS